MNAEALLERTTHDLPPPSTEFPSVVRPKTNRLAVAAIILRYRSDGKEEILLAHRRPDVRIAPNLWELPGGKVDPGEDLEIAIKREVLEEVGAEIDLVSQVGVYQHSSNDSGALWAAVVYTAMVKSTSRSPRIMEPDKVDRLEWFEPYRLPTVRHPVAVGALSAYFSGREIPISFFHPPLAGA